MAITHLIELEVCFALSVKASTTEAQIRSFLAGYRNETETYLQGIVDSAPAAAEAIYVSTEFTLDVTAGDPGAWWIEIEIPLTVETADTITTTQVWDFLAGYYQETKTKVRNLVNSAPAGRQAKVVLWHIHRHNDVTDESVE